MRNTYEWFYLGQTESRELENINQMFFIPRIIFVIFVRNEFTRLKESERKPFFIIYPFLNENEKELRKFKKQHFIKRWKQMNTYQ